MALFEKLKRVPPLAILLPVQALLLFWNLDLLPIWTDELFTLRTVQKPLDAIAMALKADIHPPLYYFQLHLLAVAGAASLAAMRAVSGLWALAGTALLDLLWTRAWKPERRWTALSLLAFSPCLLLYGRMARSYSMQLTLSLLAVWTLWQWTRKPGSLVRAGAAGAALLAVLYTHYVPGLALAVAFACTMWRAVGLRRVLAFGVVVFAGYLPWLVTLEKALAKWGEASGFSSQYSFAGGSLLGQVIEAGFWVVSLTIGETVHPLSFLLVPLILLLILAGTRSSRLTPMLCLAGALGYVAVARWVSYPFIPARLLWLLPFGAMSVAISKAKWRWIAPVLVSYALSTGFYFSQSRFLNMGYVAPLREIAGEINAQAQAGDLILVDDYNTDAESLRHYVSSRATFIALSPSNVAEAKASIPQAKTVWVVRNERDISPGGVTTQVEEMACAGRERARQTFLPLAPWQKAALGILGIRGVDAFYVKTVCRAAR